MLLSVFKGRGLSRGRRSPGGIPRLLHELAEQDVGLFLLAELLVAAVVHAGLDQPGEVGPADDREWPTSPLLRSSGLASRIDLARRLARPPRRRRPRAGDVGPLRRLLGRGLDGVAHQPAEPRAGGGALLLPALPLGPAFLVDVVAELLRVPVAFLGVLGVDRLGTAPAEPVRCSASKRRGARPCGRRSRGAPARCPPRPPTGAAWRPPRGPPHRPDPHRRGAPGRLVGRGVGPEGLAHLGVDPEWARLLFARAALAAAFAFTTSRSSATPPMPVSASASASVFCPRSTTASRVPRPSPSHARSGPPSALSAALALILEQRGGLGGRLVGLLPQLFHLSAWVFTWPMPNALASVSQLEMRSCTAIIATPRTGANSITLLITGLSP